jgi:hypothetical protein
LQQRNLILGIIVELEPIQLKLAIQLLVFLKDWEVGYPTSFLLRASRYSNSNC